MGLPGRRSLARMLLARPAPAVAAPRWRPAPPRPGLWTTGGRPRPVRLPSQSGAPCQPGRVRGRVRSCPGGCWSGSRPGRGSRAGGRPRPRSTGGSLAGTGRTRVVELGRGADVRAAARRLADRPGVAFAEPDWVRRLDACDPDGLLAPPAPARRQPGRGPRRRPPGRGPHRGRGRHRGAGGDPRRPRHRRRRRVQRPRPRGPGRRALALPRQRLRRGRGHAHQLPRHRGGQRDRGRRRRRRHHRRRPRGHHRLLPGRRHRRRHPQLVPAQRPPPHRRRPGDRRGQPEPRRLPVVRGRAAGDRDRARRRQGRGRLGRQHRRPHPPVPGRRSRA